MKQVSFLLLLIFSTVIVQAQMAGGAGTQAPPKMGRIFGKLADSTGKHLGDASVMLLQTTMDTVTKKTRDRLLKGTTTQANGDFNFEELPVVGEFKLNISATGYKPITHKVSMRPAMSQGGGMPNFEKDLGEIKLGRDEQELSGVVVSATTSRLRMDIDKKVFSVDQNIVTAGGTGVDVMKNVPSVNVDIDGNVTMRNATPQLYVDGRPSTLTLDQIPADAIESVEIITNPSAKFDASGGNAGIINVVLKKNKKTGYNGNLNFGVDRRGGINGGGNFNYRQNKFNFTAAAFTNLMRNKPSGSSQFTDLLSAPNLFVDQNSNTTMKGGFMFGRLGMDYFATNRTTISIGLFRMMGKFNPSDFLVNDSSFTNGSKISYSERETDNEREFNGFGGQVGLKYLFPKDGEELTVDARLFERKNEGYTNYSTNVFSTKGGTFIGNDRRRIMSDGDNQNFNIQTDYVKPLGTSGKFETGLKAELRTLTNLQGNYFYDAITDQFELITASATDYSNTENIYAAYASYGNTVKKFGYKLGLRAESSQYKGELKNGNVKYNNDYPISLFPSLFLSQKLENQQELQLSYTRRINRPFFMQVIPNIDSANDLNWSRGNPNLRPEFTNSLEASYTKTMNKGNMILASVYYKYTTDLITRFTDTITLDKGNKRPISTSVNANSSRNVGAEATATINATKWWDFNANLNVYNAQINTDNITNLVQEAMWSYFAKWNNNLKFPNNFKMQLSATYQSKTNMPVSQGGGMMGGGHGGGPQSAAQGYIKANWGVDAAIAKSFLKKNAATVTLSVNDVFATRNYEQYTISPYFVQSNFRQNDAPMVRLNFSYKFGEMDVNLFKRKNMRGEGEGMQNATQGMGGR